MKRTRLVILGGALSAGALALALSTAGTASAASAWGGPQPTPTEVVYTPPPQHHQAKPVCEYSIETEHDTVADVPGADQQPYGGNDWAAGAPSSAPYGQPDYGNQDHSDQVTVEQVVRFCVYEGKEGHPDTVKVWDVTQPFAWVDEQGGEMNPTPSGYSSALAPFLHK